LDENTAELEGERMKCEEVGEFVSAICDGESIPVNAAEHIDRCETCRCRLKEYAEIGAELRLAASLESSEEPEVRHWKKEQRVMSNWWRRGWETMRIPRFAFALLLLAVVGLSSNLLIGRVRAHTRGRVLMLTAKPAEGHTLPCTLVAGSDGYCRTMRMEGTDGGRGVYTFRIIADDGEHIELGIRSARIYRPISKDDIKDDIDGLPETTYSVTPGETLHIDIPGAGNMEVDTKLWDHYPSPGEVWDYAQSIANCR
jgi:hypothetical protein